MLDTIKEKLYKINEYLATKGIVFPFLRDNGVPSVSLSLLIFSVFIWTLGILEIVKDMDMEKAENLVWAMSGLYFSRKITKDGKGKVELDNKQGDTKGEQ